MKVYSGLDKLPTGRASEEITEGCLVLEGGGWKGLYTLGVLDAFMVNGINLRSTVGISAGALSAIGYVSGQIGWGARIDLTYRHDKEYCGIGAMIRDHGVTGFTYLYKDIVEGLPLDKKRLMDPSRSLAVGVTNMRTGETEYMEKGKCNLSAAVRASATVPYVSRPVVMKGIPYLDGGCSTKIPYPYATSIGAKKIVVVKTREWAFRRSTAPNGVAMTMYRRYPEFVKCMNRVNDDFNKMTDQLYKLHEEGKIFALAPSKPVDVARFEGNMEKLGDLYWLGYEDASRNIDRVKEYLR
ncbi:MAG: patatin family protein [Lachnospiraceae bacterium]|nr:patatin family protein [Lachnospiraceae bacterium]